MAINELSMEGAHLQMMWDKTMVAVPFTVPTAAKTLASIEKVMAGPEPEANDYYSAATFYLDANMDLQQAHDWISKAVDVSPEAFWMHRKKALIEAKMGNKSAAIATAMTSLALAEKAGNMDYVKLNKDSLMEWGVKL
jgi:tetratricopeptide (TPR) repeat protein